MRIQHLLLLSSIAVAAPGLAGEPKPTANGKPQGAGSAKTEAPGNAIAGDKPAPARPAQKDRVHYTFPPSAKRM
jgi:hypothetical protein